MGLNPKLIAYLKSSQIFLDYAIGRAYKISNFFLRSEIGQSEKLTQEEFTSYQLDYSEPLHNEHDSYYLTKLTHGNTRMIIILTPSQQLLIAYFVFGNDKKAIKAYKDNLKGSDCFNITSKLYENGDLEVQQRNCKKKVFSVSILT